MKTGSTGIFNEDFEDENGVFYVMCKTKTFCTPNLQYEISQTTKRMCTFFKLIEEELFSQF